MFVAVFVFWIGLCFAAAILATRRGRNPFGWMLLSIVISPLLGFIFLLVLPEKTGDVIIDRRGYDDRP